MTTTDPLAAPKVIRFDRPLTKHEIVKHLEREHSQAVAKPIAPHRWTKDALVDLHRLIHLGLGR